VTSANSVLAVAASQIGYLEGARNNTKYGAWYGLNFNPWCDMFVSWCFDQAGGADIGGHFAYCPSHVNWFRNRNQWQSKYATPVRGDVVFYSWDGGPSADHVGIVESVTGSASLPVVAIEGNSSNAATSEGVAVARHQRSIAYILGFGRPAYDNAAYRPPPIVDPTPVDWDGVSYPGRAAFNLGSFHPAVTKLGQMLVAKGFGAAYKQGPGVPMGQADVDNCAAFQRAQGWTGTDADGYPGPETWRRLSAAAAPPPPPPPPAVKIPPTQGYQGNVYLGKLVRGQQDSDSVKVFQRALRNYPGISTIPLNPSGVTGNYGPETEAMCRKVYETFNQWQPGAGWGDGDLGVPGRSLLDKLGCRIVG
jgi:hypothetical protein